MVTKIGPKDHLTEISSGRNVLLVDLICASLAIGAASCVASMGFEQLPGWLCRRS